ncbi:MAG: NADH-quinone oxidoreductase subunit L [Planctomycetes bacterium]|jgi:NADH-quinone oxidoreductase subunit L|nr:NADH-quinone oxidoreductase subunit L [Planctomycetota bacterium]
MLEANTVATLAYIILFAPFAAAALITVATLRSKALSAFLSVGSVILGGVLSIILLADQISRGAGAEPVVHQFTWALSRGMAFHIGVQVDFISVLMSTVVGVVGSCIFVYALGYMHGDEGWSRFFAKFAFFAFSMLGITFSTNFLQIFIFWELVGVSSYLLIGYFYQKPSAAEAGKKAFMTNRIGDFGMTIGILLLFFAVRDVFGEIDSLSFETLKGIFTNDGAREQLFAAMGWKAALGAFLIFVGAMGKSAQFPLHVWLPDAMEGPTPVSALMHAATMVAAGVYMIVRTYWLFAWAHDALVAVAYIGGFTALLAASIAIVQNDIKKILAYSTLSQLGYMVMACGLVGAGAGMFHLATHAFFKALLFLGAGSVIHACHSNDIWDMGGLGKKMKQTTWTFWAGTLALAGIFPLAGFWSKDEILAVSHHATALYIVGVGVAFMTAFYMGRACFTVFHGTYRGHGHPHESPRVMWIPLAVLAVVSIFGGFVGAPSSLNPFGEHGLQSFLLVAYLKDGVVHWPVGHGHVEAGLHLDVATVGTLMALGGLLLAWLFYGKGVLSAERVKQRLKPLHTLLVNKYYIDDFYLWLVRRVQQGFAIAANWLEQKIIIGVLVNGIAAGTKDAAARLRKTASGQIHSYVTIVLAGVTILVFWFVIFMVSE